LEDVAARRSADVALGRVGLEAKSADRASTLTASEQRRLMLAAALATEPRVLLLDEISAGGTAADVRQLAAILADLRDEGVSIVLVEHNLRLVRDVASTVVVLSGGRTIATGPPAQVATLPEVQAAYLGRHAL
jgi:branched-chain amino acid transport system ATP-binding protein